MCVLCNETATDKDLIRRPVVVIVSALRVNYTKCGATMLLSLRRQMGYVYRQGRGMIAISKDNGLAKQRNAHMQVVA